MKLHRSCFYSDDRASVVPVGFILVIGIITLMLYVFQASTVPMINQQAEVDTHQGVRVDMHEFHSAVSRAMSTGVAQSVVFHTKVEYPPQLGATSQPDTSLFTSDKQEVTFQNAVLSGGSGAGWNGSNRTYPTRPVHIVPDYNWFQNAQQVQYEHSVVHYAPANSGNKTNVATTSQSVVSGNQITIYQMKGELAVTRRNHISVNVHSDTSPEQVNVTNSTGDNIELTLETSLSESQWRSLLESERATNGGHITNITYNASTNPNRMTLTFEQNVTYEVKIFEVELSHIRING